MNKKIAIISVINDIVSDNRIARTADVLVEMGFDVKMIGRRKKNSPKLKKRNYYTKRMNLIFEKGPFFYIEFNIRLFIFLLFNKANLLISNDLDTLLPNYLISKLKKINLVYDSHEYFTETPELIGRKRIQNIWKLIEKSIVPKLKYAITVSQGISDLFYEKYKVRFNVVRNIPQHIELVTRTSVKELNLPEDKPIIILQGAGINIDRGAEEAVLAMKYIDAILLIIGSGDVIPLLKKMVIENNLENKVIFKQRMPKEELFLYTSVATIGLSIDKDTNINYRYSLPNKLFDYLHANTPILASNLHEVSKIVTSFEVGKIIPNHNPEVIAKTINEMLDDKELLDFYTENCKKACKELNWESEKQVLINIFSNFV